jgi:putative DNA-invertase from lambdoid prophage Rac
MARVFAYCRVSTCDQTTENQVREIAAAGFAVDPRRVIEETVSGSVAASLRPGFAKLLERLDPGDVLVTTKLDRLGRNAMDVRQTIELLTGIGVRVHCLALGGMDLTSPAGKMTMGVIASVAEFERDLLIERTHAGLERAKAEGKQLGRPVATGTRDQVQREKVAGMTQARAAAVLGLSTRTVKRYWNQEAAQ